MLDTPRSEVVWRVLSTHIIHHFPLHFPSRASPCAITFQLDCSNAGAPCSEVVWRVLATHSIRQFPLHFPFRSSPCAITFQLDSKMTCARKWPLIQNGTKFKKPPSLPDLLGVRWLIMQKDKFNTTGCVVYLYNTQFLTQLSHCLCSDTFLSISLHIVFNLKALVLECLSVLTLSFTQRLRTWRSGFDSRGGLFFFYCDCEQTRFWPIQLSGFIAPGAASMRVEWTNQVWDWSFHPH